MSIRKKLIDTIMRLLKTKTTVFFLFICSAVFANEWPCFRGNSARTGAINAITSYPQTSPDWKKHLPAGVISSPVISEGMVFIGSRDSCFYALDTADGDIIWKRKTRDWVDATAHVAGTRVAIGSRDSTIYIFEKYSGGIIAQLSAGLQLSSPLVMADGSVVSGTGEPRKGLTLYKGKNITWDRTDPDWTFTLPQASYSSPASKNNIVIVGSNDGAVVAFDVETRDSLWTFETTGGIYLSTPAIYDETVYFAPGNYDKNIYALNLSDGSPVWQSTPLQGNDVSLQKKSSAKQIDPFLAQRMVHMPPVKRNKVLMQLQSAGVEVPAILRSSGLGKTTRSTATDDFFALGDMKTSSVSVDEQQVYVIQKELGIPKPRYSFIVLDRKSGVEKWRFSELRNAQKLGYCASPAISGNLAFFGWGEGNMYAFNKKNGARAWQDSLDGDIISSPAIAHDALYVATNTGTLYKYSLNLTAAAQNFNEGTYCYPNPARNESRIQAFAPRPGRLELTIFNTTEKPILRKNASVSTWEKYEYRWNLNGVANGVYFAHVKLFYDDGSTDKKIMKIAVLK